MQNEVSHSMSINDIDDYLLDEMGDDSISVFEQELLVNKGLSSDLAFHRELNNAIIEEDVMNLRDSLQTIAKIEQSQKNRKLGLVSPSRKNLIWYAAASIVILFGISGLLRNKEFSTNQLYASYYKPYTNNLIINSRSASSEKSDLSEALMDIESGKYVEALKILSTIESKDKNGYCASFYSGVVFQELKDYHNAINSFSKVIKHGDNLLVEQSEWYIGLCYLGSDEREKAIAQLKSIAAKKGYYEVQSIELLKQLK